MVDSWYCLDWFVPEGISQVSRRSEVGNTKRRSLNTRLSSGTSAGSFAVSAVRGPLHKLSCQPRYEKRTLTCFWYHFKKKGWKIDHHVSNLRTRGCLFQGVQVHPYLDLSSFLSSVDVNLSVWPLTIKILVRKGLEKDMFDWKDLLRARIESITSPGNTLQKIELKTWQVQILKINISCRFGRV